jgi:hypothetical protein
MVIAGRQRPVETGNDDAGFCFIQRNPFGGQNMFPRLQWFSE